MSESIIHLKSIVCGWLVSVIIKGIFYWKILYFYNWKRFEIQFKHDALKMFLKIIIMCSTIELQLQLKLYIFAHFLDPIGTLIDGLLYLYFKGVTPLLLNLSLYILSNLHHCKFCLSCLFNIWFYFTVAKNGDVTKIMNKFYTCFEMV